MDDLIHWIAVLATFVVGVSTGLWWAETKACFAPVDPERIIAAAISVRGLIVSMPRPARHHDVMHALRGVGVDERDDEEDAFLTSEGRFVDRHDALSIARVANQITARGKARLVNGNPMLFSEDVW